MIVERQKELPKEVQSVLRDLRFHFSGRGVKVVLYGSQSRGTADPKSDFDINVIFNFDKNKITKEDCSEVNKELRDYLASKYKFKKTVFGVNPSFKIGNFDFTVTAKFSLKGRKGNLFFRPPDQIIENFPSIAIMRTKEKNSRTEGEYIKTIVLLKSQLRKFGFTVGGFVLESLLYKIPDELFMIYPVNKRFYKIMSYLSEQFSKEKPESWEKLDRPDKLFTGVAKWKYYVAMYFIKVVKFYLQYYK